MSDLHLRLFGPPRVERDGEVLRFDTRKAIALLAYLAVTGRPHGRDAIAALLWPGGDRARARATLRRTLSVMGPVGPALRTDGGAVALDGAATWCDVVEFRRLAASEEPGDWRRAVDLAAGDVLEGFAVRDSPAFEDWHLATADAVRDTLSATLGRLVAVAVADGDLAGALDFARRRVGVDPLSEPAHADLIRLTAWTGDRPGALRLYRALVRVLDRELGVPPLPETTALHEAIRADRLEDPPARPAEPVLAPRASGPGRPEGDADAPPAVVDRVTERARMLAAWEGASEAGGCVGLVGESGMGKTFLATDLAARVRRDGGAVVVVAGHAAEQGLAFAAATDLVRGLLAAVPDLRGRLGGAGGPLGVLAPELGEVAPSIDTPGDLRRLYEAVGEALATLGAGPAPALVVIDDAHLLDPASAGLLGFLVRRMPRGVLALATWPSGSGHSPLPFAVRDHAGAGGLLTLGPLDVAAVAALLARAGIDAADAAQVLRRTGGVPLLVLEHAAADDDAASDVREMVAARLGAAPATTQQLVGAAAVIGTAADPDLLRAACGRDEEETVEAIEDAVARGLLVERADRSGYDLPHDLVRTAALGRLSLARARLLHGRVADALARRNAVDPMRAPAGAVARHLAEAGREADAGAWFVAAAEESTRLFAHAEALEQLRAALALGFDPATVHEATGEALVRLGRYGEALVAFEQAAALVEDDPARLGAIEHAIAGVHDRRGDWGLAQAHLEAARSLLDAADARRLARVHADLALVHHRLGRPDEARTAATTAARLASAAGDMRAVARAGNVHGILAASTGDEAAAEANLEEAVRIAAAVGAVDVLVAALNNLARVRREAGRHEVALESARQALALAERLGDLHHVAALHSHVADLLHALGQDEEALVHLKASAAAFAGVHEAGARPEVWTLTEW